MKNKEKGCKGYKLENGPIEDCGEIPSRAPLLLEAVQRGSGPHPACSAQGQERTRCGHRTMATKVAPGSFLLLVACVTSLARASSRLRRSSCDATAARCCLLLSLTT